MADIAVITGASSGLGVKFLEAVVKNYAASMHFSQSDFQEVIHLV